MFKKLRNFFIWKKILNVEIFVVFLCTFCPVSSGNIISMMFVACSTFTNLTVFNFYSKPIVTVFIFMPPENVRRIRCATAYAPSAMCHRQWKLKWNRNIYFSLVVVEMRIPIWFLIWIYQIQEPAVCSSCMQTKSRLSKIHGIIVQNEHGTDTFLFAATFSLFLC